MNADGASLAELARGTSILDAWRDYALADLSSGFSWAKLGNTEPVAPSVFDRGNARIAPPASRFAGAMIDPPLVHVTYLKASVGDTPAVIPATAPDLMQDFVPGLQRYIVAPSFSQRWGENSAFSLSAIFAYQRFAGLGLGQGAIAVRGNTDFSALPPAYRNSPGSYGTGIRAEFNSALNTQLSWQVGYQSRVNMDAFNNYRGVYSEPGSFDIPASANLGLGYALTPRFKIDLGMQRVMYSGIAPFTSDALPTRFLVLLGSSISPAFEWRDLSVYSAGWTWSDPANGMWSVHYSTREQPLPTSRLLQNALEPYLATHDVEFRFARPIGEHSNLRLAATYAPAQFVLGLPTSNSLRNGNSGGQIEYEVSWTTQF
ncbi:MAG TPA: hypothetical protein VFN13_01030 [Rudaea sp.]|nr:hypothetical protein [Rudaea sp.]